MRIHKIYTMEGEYEDVEYEGDIEEFIHKIENSSVIRIIEYSKLIYINSDYIISFEI